MHIYAKVLLDGAASATVNWIGAGTLATYGGIQGYGINILKMFMGFSQSDVANTIEIIETHVVTAASSTNSTFKIGAPGTSGAFFMDFQCDAYPHGIGYATQTATAVGYKVVQNSTGTLTAWFIGTTD
jgi:hypothetical protein